MTHRDATVDDAPAISRFVTALTVKHISQSLTDGGLAKLLASMDVESTRTRIADGWTHILDVMDDQIHGIVVVKPPTHLFHLFVETGLQRSGIGRRLLGAANDRTVMDTGSQLTTVNSSINAVDAYVRLGFTPDGPIVDADGVRFQPMIRDGGS